MLWDCRGQAGIVANTEKIDQIALPQLKTLTKIKVQDSGVEHLISIRAFPHSFMRSALLPLIGRTFFTSPHYSLSGSRKERGYRTLRIGLLANGSQ